MRDWLLSAIRWRLLLLGVVAGLGAILLVLAVIASRLMAAIEGALR